MIGKRPLGLAVAVLFLVVVLALWLGETAIDPRNIGVADSDDARLFFYRLPRTAVGLVAGAGLAVSGAALQLVWRNPLADPYLLGVSGGSAVGATLAIAFGVGTLGFLGDLLLPGSAFLGGVLATLIVRRIAARVRVESSVLLAGVMVNAVSASLITFMKALLPSERTQELLFWLIGFLDRPRPLVFVLLLVLVASGSALLLHLAAKMNLLALGRKEASHLGIDAGGLERSVLLAAALVVGAIVSVTGMIGFVGLIVPHVVRRAVGPDARRLLPLSIFYGGALVVASDLVTRILAPFIHSNAPVGAVTAILGSGLFVLLAAERETTTRAA